MEILHRNFIKLSNNKLQEMITNVNIFEFHLHFIFSPVFRTLILTYYMCVTYGYEEIKFLGKK